MDNKNNITWSDSYLSREKRESMIGQKGMVIWLTGLSGSGKSTIAKTLEISLMHNGKIAYVLDGDNLRHGLNMDLGFSDRDRIENIRRIGEIAALFADAGIIVITAFISPFEKGRKLAEKAAGSDRFFEVFLDTPLEVCERRDPKGLYKKARKGELSDFTGIDSIYERPLMPKLTIDTGSLSVEESVQMIINMLEKH